MDETPRAVISGSNPYLIYIEAGLIHYGPNGYGWITYNKKRARKIAKRELTKYIKRQEPQPMEIVTKGDL